MPGRSPEEARKAFLEPLQRALSCVTDAKLFVSRGKQPGDVEALALSEDPLRLVSARIGPVQFVLGHQFKVVQDGRRSWHVSTAAYRYHLLDDTGLELIGPVYPAPPLARLETVTTAGHPLAGLPHCRVTGPGHFTPAI
jgi:hypothetical protein